MDNISPEEILKRKEMMGGVEYDDPIENEVQLESNESKPVTEIANEVPIYKEPLKPLKQEHADAQTSNNFGKAQSVSPGFDTGWKNLPVEILPSGGIFYPEGTKLAIRSAEVKEIRHFSTIDDDDRLDRSNTCSRTMPVDQGQVRSGRHVQPAPGRAVCYPQSCCRCCACE
jgi:hypothetical protein